MIFKNKSISIQNSTYKGIWPFFTGEDGVEKLVSYYVNRRAVSSTQYVKILK